MSALSGLPGEVTAYEQLADAALDGPGTAGPRAALGLLDLLARRADLSAALSIARVAGTELGLDVSALVPRRCPSFAALAELAGTPGAPELPCMLAAGYLPWRFAADLKRWTQTRTAFDPGPWAAFQALVARRGAALDYALRGYAVAAVGMQAGLTATLAETDTAKGPPPELGHVTRLVHLAMDARVVPGDNADTSFRFGADLLLAVSASGLISRMGHELGHHLFDHVVGRPLEARLRDTSADCAILAAELPGVLSEILGAVPGSPGYRLIHADRGLRIGCSRDEHDRGAMVHVSMSFEDTSVTRDEAGALGHMTVRLLGADAAAAGISHGGVLHIGVPAAQVDLDGMPGRAARAGELAMLCTAHAADWLAELDGAGRWCAHEGDLRYRLGLESRPAFAAIDPGVAEDLDELRRAAEAADLTVLPADELRLLLGAAVRCGEPSVAATLISAGAHRGGDGDVGQVGASRAVLWDGQQVIGYLGAPPGEMLAVIGHLAGAGFAVSGAVLDNGETLLTDAAGRDRELTVALLDAGVRPGERNARGATGLASARSAEVAEALLDAGADPDAADADGMTALHQAVRRDNAGLAGVLLSHGASAGAVNRAGETPLMFARSAGMVAALTSAGADVEARTTTGQTALMRAAHRGDEPVVRALLAGGADVDAATWKGETALHHAAQAPLTLASGVISALLAGGAAIDEETDNGQTALLLAAVIAGEEAVETLIAAGADVNAATSWGGTPLIAASTLDMELSREFTYTDRMIGCMRRLIDAGADVDATDSEGRTALHYATQAFYSGIAAVLLEAGADPNVRDRGGQTPLGNARAQGHQAIIDDLLAHGAVDPPERGGDD